MRWIVAIGIGACVAACTGGPAPTPSPKATATPKKAASTPRPTPSATAAPTPTPAPADPIPASFVRQAGVKFLDLAPDGTPWIATDQEVLRLEGGKARPVSMRPAAITGIAATPGGDLLVGTADKQVTPLGPDGKAGQAAEPDLAPIRPVVSTKGVAWFTAADGVYHVFGGGLPERIPTGGPGPIAAATATATADLWVAAGPTVVVIEREADAVTRMYTLPAPAGAGLAVDAKGQGWCVLADGRVVSLGADGKVGAPVAVAATGPLALDGTGRPWVVTAEGLVGLGATGTVEKKVPLAFEAPAALAIKDSTAWVLLAKAGAVGSVDLTTAK